MAPRGTIDGDRDKASMPGASGRQRAVETARAERMPAIDAAIYQTDHRLVTRTVRGDIGLRDGHLNAVRSGILRVS